MPDFDELERMRRRAIPLRGVPVAQLAKAARPREVRIELSIVEHEGQAFVWLGLGSEGVRLTPDRAEEVAVDLRSFALEVRNGGRL